MTEYKNYIYQSVLAPYIQGLISEKRSHGFIYNIQAYQLKRFDDYWCRQGYTETCISAEMLHEWLCCLPGEGKSSHSGRITAVKSLTIYMNTLGIRCYVPLICIGKDHPIVHILNKKEIQELFFVIDSYTPASRNPADFRMANEYPLMFRLYYCCGMRNQEVCALETSDVDLEAGLLTVRNGKNHKDRLIYLPEDLRQLSKKYFNYLKRALGYTPFWFFPGRCPFKHVDKSQIDKKFRIFWNQTDSSKYCDKNPTPHCLRHTFVVDRINQWILEGTDIHVMMIYLSKYLGHKDPDGSFYYYHLVADAFQIIHQKDTMAEKVIPEVRRR